MTMEGLSSHDVTTEAGEEELAQVVGISSCDSTPLVWRAADLRAVRSHRLVGALVGSLPRTPRQNCRMGRPLLLLPEEERVLVELHKAAALPRPRPQDSGSVDHKLVDQHEEEQQRSFEEQKVLALQDRKSALLRAFAPPEDAASVCTASREAVQGRLDALEQNFNFPSTALMIQLSTARAGLGYCSDDRAFLQANWPIKTQDTPHYNARYQVFRDLRGRGFYLTSAGKFGGDFLVYPGDPLRFHAHFIAVCVCLDESIPLLDVLAVARLGSNVKKTVLLCSPGDGPDGGVVYTSLQWSGMV